MSRWIVGFVVAVMMAACSQTVSASSDESSANDTAKDVGSSGSNGDISSSSEEELAEDCVGESGRAWDGTTAKAFACGSGTKLSPFIILTAEQLAYLSFVVGASEKDYQGKYFKLAADILLNEGKVIDDKGGFVADSAKLHKWTPIGNSSVAFDGNFDGAGHTVSGMFINTTSSHNGLFGNSSGTVQNVTVENSWVSGGKFTGSIIGNMKGAATLANPISRTSVFGNGDGVGGVVGNYQYVCCNKVGKIVNAKNYGNVSAVDYVGGIIGSAKDIEISDSENFGEVIGRSKIGGIVGNLQTNTLLSNAKNFGKVVGKDQTGGIIGYFGYCCSASGTLKNAKNNGKIEGEKFTGGIIGKNENSTNLSVTNNADVVGTLYSAGLFGYVKNSTTKSMYNTGDVFGSDYVGGIAGYNQEGVTSAAYSTGKVDGDSLVGLMIGYNYNTTMADYYYLKQGEQEPFGLNNGGGVATPKTVDEMKSESFATLLGDEFVYKSGVNDGFPILKWEE
jgi:hypothetical protein